MKIDKVIWASSVEYSDFWNINSKIHKKYLGIDCVLLFYGKKSNYNLNEEFGKVIECSFEDGVDEIAQLIFNKWHHVKNEPDTTWLIGDIDQIPLVKDHFVDNIEFINENSYAHLAEDAFGPKWRTNHIDGRLAGYYHAGKGSTITKALNLEKSLAYHTKELIKESKKNKCPIWAYEEAYIPKLIKENGCLDKFESINRYPKSKICRSSNSSFDLQKLKNGEYIDYHCPRPYNENKETINKILSIAWGDEINDE